MKNKFIQSAIIVLLLIFTVMASGMLIKSPEYFLDFVVFMFAVGAMLYLGAVLLFADDEKSDKC
ncbi:MAG: hypothetical protein J6W29_02110 [Neisseriaceae bacterium]|nr:hypothetical protein [Neisseriaceae bacterium]